MSREKALNYHDVLLYKQDVELLNGPYWLNDQIIAFYFEYFGREKFSSSKSLGFCPGCLTFLLLQSEPSEIALIITPLKLAEKGLVFLACNDNPDAETAKGGSHWSLVVYDTREKMYRHYDSSGSSNEPIARTLARQLAKAGLPGDYHRGSCPRQENGYDCGIYVLALADAISGLYLSARSWEDIDTELLETVTPDTAAQLRKNILGLIKEKRRKA